MSTPIPIPKRNEKFRGDRIKSDLSLRKHSLIKLYSKSNEKLSPNGSLDKASYISINDIRNSFGSDKHPLEDDSDNESVFDESFDNSSVASSNSSVVSSLSLLPWNCKYQKTKSIPQTLNLTVNWTPKQPLMNGDGIRNMRQFLNNEPVEEKIPYIELQTFKQCEIMVDSTPINRPTFKNRDERINTRFLRMYAIDYHCRSFGYLPHSTSDLIPTDQMSFHAKHDLYKLSVSSRDKLWQNIILPPRADPAPKDSIDYEDYVFDNKRIIGSSLTMKNGNYLPWSAETKSLKPSGIMNKRPLVNGSNPNSGVTYSQYTIKGWSNSRWV